MADSTSNELCIYVPVYNAERYLRKCIESIQTQSYKVFHIVFVDDGALDNSARFLDDTLMNDDRITVVHQINGGLVRARKTASELVNSEYVIAIDADDWVDRDYLLNFERIIIKTNPDIICAGYTRYYQDKSEVKKTPYVDFGYYNKERKEQVLTKSIIFDGGKELLPNICSKVFRASLYKQYQLMVDDEISIGEDAACTVPCMLAADSIFISNTTGYYYRCNDSSMTRARKEYPWNTILKRMHLTSQQINLQNLELRKQYNSYYTNVIFNAIVEEFQANTSFFSAKRKINEYLNREECNCVIKGKKKMGFNKYSIAAFALRYRLLALIKFFSIILYRFHKR